MRDSGKETMEHTLLYYITAAQSTDQTWSKTYSSTLELYSIQVTYVAS